MESIICITHKDLLLLVILVLCFGVVIGGYLVTKIISSTSNNQGSIQIRRS